MLITCQVFPLESGEGPANMALDEALLDAALEVPGTAFFRTYRWREPTLSLGYFQAVGEVDSDLRWHGMPIVRRPTGGGAILHDREVTYALVLPASHPSARRGGTLYRDVHAAIAEVFAGLGAAVERRGDTPPAGSAARPFLCFADRDPEDLVLGRSKVVGSAQRRRAGAVLQHGSILLRRSPAAPELAGAGDLAPVPTGVEEWSAALGVHIPAALGLQAEPSAVEPAVRRRAAELERAVYLSDTWTRRR